MNNPTKEEMWKKLTYGGDIFKKYCESSKKENIIGYFNWFRNVLGLKKQPRIENYDYQEIEEVYKRMTQLLEI